MSRLWLPVPLVLVLLARLATAATLQTKVDNAVASLAGKTVRQQIKLTNAGVNGWMTEAVALYEGRADPPRMAGVLAQYGSDSGAIPAGQYGYAALKCGILLQAGVDARRLLWTMLTDGTNPSRVVVLYVSGQRNQTETWVLDSLNDEPWKLDVNSPMVSEHSAYRCDTFESEPPWQRGCP